MILVTGGTGLVGAHLLAKLVATEEKIRATFRSKEKLAVSKKIFSYYYAEETDSYFSRIEWAQADITDIPALSDAFQGITNVYHCAGFISFDPSDKEILRKINIEGTANIVNLCLSFNIHKLCHVSSVATLENQFPGKPVTEESNFDLGKNHSWYSITKYAAEIEVWRGSQEGLDVVIVNPGIIIGPGTWNSGSGLLFQKIWEGFSYHFPKTTGFVAVEDVAAIMVQLMNSPIKNERFLLSAENLDFKTLLNTIANVLKKPIPTRSLKPWMLSLGWTLQWIGNKLFGIKRQIPKSSNKSLFEVTIYDSSKIKNALSLEFSPIKDSVEHTGAIFLKEKNN